MEDNQQALPKREEKPKFGPKEDPTYRIKGLEEAKKDPSMTRADIAALDRVINKLKAQISNNSETKSEE